jgi:phosphoribosylpyrophosphate synthetase
MDDWRAHSDSPKILNYKVGKEKDIQLFVRPFLQMVDQVLTIENASEAHLVPMPSSRSPNNPDFSGRPRSTSSSGARNRDDRNLVFCKFLTQYGSSHPLYLADVISRKHDKPEKAKWDFRQQANSFEMLEEHINFRQSSVVILVDDVFTTGGTFKGAKLLFNKIQKSVPVICLALGKTTPFIKLENQKR